MTKTMPGIVLAIALFLLVPATGWSHPDAYSYYGQDGQGGNPLSSFLSSPFVAAFDPAPLVPRLPAPAAPQAPPGMCRWERAVLDGAGRPIFDRYGRPIKEYTVGSCVSPPAY
ncbi:MAG: hypothetical protein LBD10_10740 [Desulfobulbus sp.]|jgi:hypothetical protein|uniref:hypothetical protein n=1 Tax=Desulfobulbus sp. TaxID=895 RepID=UPI00283E55BD|nr:hypothetical protein [Desulfobulbus sp.]MDR2550662.1 hypothetical protein [Desulfobulbus sp.]